ncbi:MAG: fumarate hydratase [Kiritimatiellae bacterium]|nr:fumarate hydratase [Kiritimatiellia bacterium]
MNRTVTDQLAELIRINTSCLPEDVESALVSARAAATSPAELQVLDALLENAHLARDGATPVCQDTGTPTFFFTVPPRTDEVSLRKAAEAAAERATANGWLRRNTIDTLTGASIDSNALPGEMPVCHFRADPDAKAVTVSLLQKGGGSENMSRQFSLPDGELGAGRDLDGVRRCILRAAWEAQGYGCAPGILGVCVGGDRAEGYLAAKEQLLRPLGDDSPDPALAELERRVLREANSLGIGPMGLGGKTTLLGVKIAVRPRLPASYFVTVAYCCWACRRHTVTLKTEGGAL